MKLKKQTQNKLIKLMSKKQNDIKKLNGGQLREALSIVLKSIDELPKSCKVELVQEIIKQLK